MPLAISPRHRGGARLPASAGPMRLGQVVRGGWVAVALLVGVGCTGGGGASTSGTSGAGGAPDAVRKDVVDAIGTVNGAPLSAEDFQQEASRRPMEGEATAEDRKAVLDELVTQEVLFQEALKKGLYHDSKVRKILVNLLLRQDVYASVDSQDFTDAELEQYYTDHKDEFIVPEKVQLKRILLRITPERDAAATEAAAASIYAEVRKDPRTFGEVAARLSEGPYQRRGGDLGFISAEGKPGVEPEVVAKAFEMKVEEILPPVQIGDAFHILYVVNRRERVERSFQQMRGSVLRMVKQERFTALTDAYIAEAKGRYTVEIDQAKVDAIDLSRSAGRPRLDVAPVGLEDEEPEVEQ